MVSWFARDNISTGPSMKSGRWPSRIFVSRTRKSPLHGQSGAFLLRQELLSSASLREESISTRARSAQIKKLFRHMIEGMANMPETYRNF